MGAFANYLLGCVQVRGAGVPETSYYPALKTFLDSVGYEMKPRITALVHPRGLGGNLPDFGLVTPNQLSRAGHEGFIFDERFLPERGVVEVKGVGHYLKVLIESEQVLKYLRTYKQVLATNLREFAIVQLEDGKAKEIERYSLGATEAEFWQMAQSPAAAERRHGKPLEEFITRAMYGTIQLETPQELAFFLASYARTARHQIDVTDDLHLFTTLKAAMEAALGIQFGEDQGDAFFRSMFVQTLFYGVFSGWVLWHEENPARTDRFNWRTTHTYLEVPIVEALFKHSTGNTVLRATGLVGIMNVVEETLARVRKPQFFAAFEQGAAVQYFYEPFLAAFDPTLRKDLGIWYTPPEIVRYMVERVDRVLKEELGEPDGLASENVIVLDPCCGTGAYLVECLRHVHRHYEARGEGQTCGDKLREAATKRLFGFELLLAPFVVSHLQMGVYLAQHGGRTNHQDRVAVYLTNALTGWNRDKYPPQATSVHELAIERTLADQVKAESPILVVLGNPPYNGYAGISKMGEERELADLYDAGKRRGQGLNDLYIRFFAMADRRIERTGKGVICFISNYSWLDGLSFAGMRARYLEKFDQIWVDNLNGDKYATGKTTPDGHSDPSVFSTEFNKEGIQVGTAVATLVRRSGSAGSGTVGYRDFWGTAKRQDLLGSLTADVPYTALTPSPALGSPFKPRTVGAGYLDWPRLTELMPTSFPGVKTSRDDLLVDIDQDELITKMKAYLNPYTTESELHLLAPSALRSNVLSADRLVRTRFCAQGYKPHRIVRFAYRPFDVRWIYWEPEGGLLDRPRPDFNANVSADNIWLVAQEKTRRDWSTAQISSVLACLDLMDRGSSCISLRAVNSGSAQSGLFQVDEPESNAGGKAWNLTEFAWEYLRSTDPTDPSIVFYHALAILHSPAYAEENAGALRQDWPRVPLPKDGRRIAASAELGRRLAALLDPEIEVLGVTSGTLPPEVVAVGKMEWRGVGSANERNGDFRLNAHWGHRGQGGVVMPARGTTVWHGLPAETVDVKINDQAWWTGIPKDVWEYTLGGYQVLKKWLSYREEAVLGRPLKGEEVREFGRIARRIYAMLAMAEALDANYRACSEDVFGG